jgi:hypothetical protein
LIENSQVSNSQTSKTKWLANLAPIYKVEFYPLTHSTPKKISLYFINTEGHIHRIGNRDRKYVGKLDKVLLINVSLPPFDKYKLCHPFNLLCNLISIGSQMAFDKYIRDPFKKNSILHSFLMSI